MTEIVRVSFPSLEKAGEISFPFPMPAVLSLKAAGDMGASGGALTDDRRSFLAAHGVEQDRFVSLRQIHSRSVHVVGAGSYGNEGDGMITTDRRLVLGVTVADCMPIFLFDRGGGAYGLLHSGWRGTGIVADAVRLMARHFETDPAELTVMIGPSIGVCCYRVDHDRASLFAGRWGEKAVINRDDGPYLDLRQANLDILTRLGVSRIIDAHVCTACNEAFSSYRRDGAKDYAGMIAMLGRFDIPADAARCS